MRSRKPLSVEMLEDRTTPATFGVAWPDPQHLTLSFAPDQTSLAGVPSLLFTTLDAVAPTAAWQAEILRAFQTWAVNANINIGVVSDNGEPFGAVGPIQGAAGVGDIRIGSYPLAG